MNALRQADTITMKSFKNRVKALFLKEKCIDTDLVEYMELPEHRADYLLAKTIGNANLTEGRFMTKKESDCLVDKFLTIPLP